MKAEVANSAFLHAFDHSAAGSLSAFFHQSVLSVWEETSSASAAYVGNSRLRLLIVEFEL